MKQTNFVDVHKMLKAKMVEFAGYEMPIQYTSIIQEHKAVRNSVGVFDVSHMGEFFVTGKEAEKLIQYVSTNDVAKLTDGKVQYSSMLYENGGVIDDMLVYKINSESFMLVVNASNIEKDFNWITKNNTFDCIVNNESDEYSLLAIQGPNSKAVVEELFGTKLDLEYYTFMNNVKYNGVDFILSRTGYTGEHGYELYFKANKDFCEKLWEEIFKIGNKFEIQPAGLGCRDSLRLEVAYCLYGNEIDQTTNTLEAGLGWITKLSKDDFIGKDALLKSKEEGLARKLVGLVSEEKCFPRHGYNITINGEVIGNITSGTVSPITEKAIALAYVKKDYSAEGSEVNFNIRGKEFKAQVVKLPFVTNNAMK